MDGATPNVITDDGLRDLLSDGYLIKVICNQTAAKRHNSWYGSWGHCQVICRALD
ncbi:hypothetical protein GI582_25025 [Sulfitobacter sp. BDSS02]|uniref:hypothetical protein n=1 Tax=Heliomarina sp. TaxID=2917556 RepID=UPI0040590A7E|nr:hypothetical protein [Sulfitobacter sp. BDSS02]